MKTLQGVYSNPRQHWVGDGFPVRSLFSYNTHGKHLSPFLLLDYAGPAQFEPAARPRGVGTHPHRGFETVTYMLAGRMRHRDNAGHEGLLTAGGVQWMTAGRGIVHSELPEQENGLMHGFQLWVNLPARDKLTAPDYRDLPAEAIPAYTADDGVTIKVIAGESDGVAGAVQREATAPLYLDLELPPGATHTVAIPPGHNAFVYIYQGQVELGRRGQRDAAGRALGDPGRRAAHADRRAAVGHPRRRRPRDPAATIAGPVPALAQGAWPDRPPP